MTPFRIHRHTAVALLIVAAYGCAHAEEKDPERLKLRAGMAHSADSNYLRLPQEKAVSDQIDSQTLDVNLALPLGQQRLELEANLINNQHQTLTQFNFFGQNYFAAWKWSLSPSLLGVLSTKHTESLNSSADSLDPTQRNKNTANLDTLTVGYLLGGPWHLLGEYSKASSANERALLGISDVRYESYTAGISYAPTNSNTLGYARRVDTGTNTSVVAGASGYSYSGHVLMATYALNTSTSIKARLAYMEQRFSLDPKFDFSGITGGVDATWHITGKTSIVAGWQRDLNSFQTLESTYAQTDTFSLAPTWQARPALSFGLQFRQGVRDALGNPNGKLSTRQDRTSDTGLTVQWQPRKYLNVRASVTQANRTSNVVNQDYSAQLVTVGAQFIF